MKFFLLELSKILGAVILTEPIYQCLETDALFDRGYEAFGGEELLAIVLCICFYKIINFFINMYFDEEEEEVVYTFKYVDGHIEVYLDGVFQFSADSVEEAKREIEYELSCNAM